MKILLWHDIETLGKRGDVVEVRDGYARNYLIPRRMASKPTPGMYRLMEVEKKRWLQMEKKLVEGAQQAAEALGKASVTIEVNTNEEGHLYGSVTPTLISEALREQGVRVEPRAIEIEAPIKQVGVFEVTVNLHHEVKPKLKVWVVSAGAAKLEGKDEAAAAPAPAAESGETKTD